MDSDLFVSDSGELRRFPEHAGAAELITPDWTPARVDREAWLRGESAPRLAARTTIETVQWHRVRFRYDPIQQGILRLLQERDELREQLCFLVDFIDAEVLPGRLPSPLSTERADRWSRFHSLWRSLIHHDWFRNRR